MDLRPVENVAEMAASTFTEVSDEIAALVPGTVIHHVGATALPTGVTKGDLDLAISVPSDEFSRVVTALREHYDVAQPENWTETYASFSMAGRPLPVGIQVAVAGSEDDFLVPLRDLMRGRSDLLARYSECKRAAAALGDDRYREAKDRFLRALFVEHMPWARPARPSR